MEVVSLSYSDLLKSIYTSLSSVRGLDEGECAPEINGWRSTCLCNVEGIYTECGLVKQTLATEAGELVVVVVVTLAGNLRLCPSVIYRKYIDNALAELRILQRNRPRMS